MTSIKAASVQHSRSRILLSASRCSMQQLEPNGSSTCCANSVVWEASEQERVCPGLLRGRSPLLHAGGQGLWPPLFGQVLSPDSCSMELLCGLVASPLSLWSSSTTHLPQQKIPHFRFGQYPKHLHSVQRNKDWLEYWLNTIQRYLTFNTISRTFAEFYLFFKNIFLILQVASRYS